MTVTTTVITVNIRRNIHNTGHGGVDTVGELHMGLVRDVPNRYLPRRPGPGRRGEFVRPPAAATGRLPGGDKHTYILTHKHIYLLEVTHTCIHTYMHTHTHIPIYTYTHTYTHTKVPANTTNGSIMLRPAWSTPTRLQPGPTPGTGPSRPSSVRAKLVRN